jgi:hypothetical protein
MVAATATAPAMAMSLNLVMVFRWFQRPFWWVLGNQRMLAEKVAGNAREGPAGEMMYGIAFVTAQPIPRLGLYRLHHIVIVGIDSAAHYALGRTASF